MSNLSLYIHWPFCLSKCPYCDFNSHVAGKIDESEWLAAYLAELDHYKERFADRNLVSVFFGGGTPSLMSPDVVASILDKVDIIWGLGGAEVTLETNPTSFEAEKFKGFKSAGVNRVSMGIQALNDKDLKFLGREHSVAEALGALDKAAGIFDNYSFDLIYARPEQTLEQWQTELEQAKKLISGHLSLYQLTIEKGTPFYSAYQKGEFQLPSEETSAQMYEHTARELAKMDMYAYEISNYAKRGFESRHNMTYWHYQEYLGIGAGAHSRLRNGQGREAVMNLHAPDKWLKSVKKDGHAVQTSSLVQGDDMIAEMVMMGLRIASGIHKAYFAAETGKALKDVINADALAMLKEQGLMREDEEFLRLTPDGFLLHSAIVDKLLDTI